MRLRLRSLLGSCLLIVAVSSGSATAQFANLHWNACDAWATDQLFAGPGVYHQVLAGWGFDAPMLGHSIRIRITSSNVYDVPRYAPGDAWRFDPAGCNAGRASAGTSAQPCPRLDPGSDVAVTYDGSAVYVTLTATHPVLDPNPGVTYVLGEIFYDHTASVPGPQNPAVACGDVQAPACFVIEEAVWFDAQNVAHPINYEYFTGVSWNGSEGHCFGDLPVQALPWSAVKRLYD